MDDAAELAGLTSELGYPSSIADIERRLPSLLASPEHLVLVGVDVDDRVLAWLHAVVCCQLESDVFVEVAGLVVAATHCGRGFGSRLLNQAEQWAMKAGARVVRVRSNVLRESAHGFYVRGGYILAKTSHLFIKALD